MAEMSQDLYDEITEYVQNNSEMVSQAATKVASKLKEAGWEISLTEPDEYDMGLVTGVVVGALLRGLHENSDETDVFEEQETPGDLSGI